MMRGLLIALLLALAGCGDQPRQLQGSGVETSPPVGYIVDCDKNPAQEHCQ